jgi:hypothetical protein
MFPKMNCSTLVGRDPQRARPDFGGASTANPRLENPRLENPRLENPRLDALLNDHSTLDRLGTI